MEVLQPRLQRRSLLSELSSLTTIDEDTPTQPITRPLAGIIAYVDVRSGSKSTINIGQGLKETLEELGASVATKLTKDVTHIIYKDGKCNLERIDSREVFLVNPLWLDSCKRCNERVSEAKYPVTGEGVGTPVVLGKVKRMRSIQPKPFEEKQISRSVEKKRKKVSTKDDNTSTKKNPIQARSPFDFILTDEEEEDEPVGLNDSQESTPDNLPQVIFTKDPLIEKSTPIVSKVSSKTSSKTKKISAVASKRSNKVEVSIEEQPLAKKPKKVDPVDSKKTSHSSTKVSKPIPSDKENLEPEDMKPNIIKLKSAKKRSSFEKQKPSIVLTSIPMKDQDMIYSIADKLGGFDFSNVVRDDTSHVICGANRRTINVLAGTAKGCWILSVDWVLKSLEAGHWLPEGAFEMITEFPSAQFFRLERQQAGLLYKPSLFIKAGSIYISDNTKPSSSDLELLLHMAGAKITTSKLKADVIIGKSEPSKICVSEAWIIESITRHFMLPFDDFLLDTIICPDSLELT